MPKFRGDDERTKNDVCPRCRTRLLPPSYPGASSRVMETCEICSSCGLDEAIGNGPVPMQDWPVERLRGDLADTLVGVKVQYRAN